MRLSVAFVAACIGFVGLTWADGSQPSMRISTNIPAQPLGAALQTLAKERKFQIVYMYDELENMKTQGAAGDLSQQEALQLLLRGTGLTYKYLDDQTVTIVPMKEGAVRSSKAAAQEGASLETQGGGESVQLAQSEGAAAPAASSNGSQSAEENRLEEVVVTAQKRKERLKDVPIAISVLGGADLDKSTSEGVNEQITRLPGVVQAVDFQSHGSQLTIRGVSAAGPLFEGASPVAYYLDGVPFGLAQSSIALDANAYDMDRIEVLRGPQGTLYGASALNGVVRILTKDADLNNFDVKARALFSGTQDGGDNYRGDLAVNVPIVDGKLAARAVLGYQNLSGWIDKPNEKDANDAQIKTFRLKVNAQPTDRLAIGATAWLSRSDFGSPSTSGDPLRNSNLQPEPNSTDYDVLGLKIGYDFGDFALAATSSYLKYKDDGILDLLIPFSFPATLLTGLDAKVLSEEIVLTSTRAGAWKWSLGSIYRDDREGLLQESTLTDDFTVAPGVVLPPGMVLPGDASRWSSKSFAVFGELTRLFMDGKFELTGGLRYFKDHFTSVERVAPSAPIDLQTSSTFDATTPRVVGSWHALPQTTVYASYAQGFRSGFGQNRSTLAVYPGAPPVKPDKLSNYEVGIKGSLMGNKLSYEAATFFIDWKDVQQPLSISDPNVDNGVPFAASINTGSASGMGAEFAATFRPVNRVELGLSFGWNDLTLDETVPTAGVSLYEKGNRLDRSPKYTASASADYVLPISAGIEGRMSLSGNYVSPPDYHEASGSVALHAVADSMLTARAAFSISAKQWVASIFADNITNEQGTPLLVPDGVGDFSARIRPRTIGLQLEYRL